MCFNRHVLVVENVFADAPAGTPALVPGAGWSRVRCKVPAPAGESALRGALGAALAGLVSEAEGRAFLTTRAPGRAAEEASRGWQAAVLTQPLLPSGRPGLAEAARLAGDSSLVSPSAVTWAWAALRASQGSLTQGCGTVVPSQRLERVLGSVAGHGSAPTAAAVLFRALVDLGLVCPLPSREGGNLLGCAAALVPDFARPTRLSQSTLERLAGDGQPGAAESPRSVRLVWDAPGSRPPPLRAVLRDLLACGGGLDGGGRDGPHLRVQCFAALEAGPTGTASDDFGPGFVLALDLAAAGPEPAAPEDPPARAQRRHQLVNIDAAEPKDSLDRLSAEGATLLVVGASGPGAAQTFWDVHCAGREASWALRALLDASRGEGATCFQAVRTVRPEDQAAGAGAASAAWPLAPPACALATAPGGLPAPPGLEALFAWLLRDGPLAPSERDRHDGSGRGGLAACCCAALLGRRALRAESLHDGGADAAADLDEADGCGAEEDGELRACLHLEACLLERHWGAAPALLAAVAGGARARSACALVLVRLARSREARARLPGGHALPLLCSPELLGDLAGDGEKPRAAAAERRGGRVEVALVTEGPAEPQLGPAQPPRGGKGSAHPVLGTVIHGPGMQVRILDTSLHVAVVTSRANLR